MRSLIHFGGKVWKILPRSWRLLIARATQPKFTVSAAAVIRNDRGEILLLDHVLRPASGWGLPGGFCKHYEQPDEALRRELFEEAGITISGLEIYRVRTIERHVEVIFTAYSSDEPQILSREITDARWMAPGELPPEMNIDQQFLIRRICGIDI
ncbi:MAG: NUDIX hydrolase [Acidobacteria bacterium]|nr:NUDIX hydrolase [Acidobacteriota bacterium]MCW5948198.1 NUDIX hydrolase [Pyrinomonadaceae bacterium]